MDSYNIVYKKSNKYSALIYSVSYNNPIEDIKKISADIRTQLNEACYILFDLLLANGDSFNRFVEGYFDGKEIKFDTINVVVLDDREQLETINDYYKGKVKEVNNSVLLSSEKFKYVRG